MRQLDCNSIYFDAMGRPLKGRVLFYVKGSTTKQAIFASDGTELANPVYTTNGKLSPQVFLKDADYSIVWESYVGDGDMKLDEDSHSWRPAGTSISLQPVVKQIIDNDGLLTVKNIAELRNVDPSTLVNGFVTLLGYTTAGDKPAVNYKWVPTGNVSDDGASIIKSSYTDVGYFELVNFDDIDSRHLGVFPTATMVEQTESMALMAAAAHRYAVNHNVNVVFHGLNESSVGYYLLPDGIYTRFYCVDSNARFVVKDNHSISLYQVGDKPFYAENKTAGFEGVITLNGANLRLSFNVANNYNSNFRWSASGKYFIDKNIQSGCLGSFDGVTPVFEYVGMRNFSFKNVKSIEGKTLENDHDYRFENSYFSDRLFENVDEIVWDRITIVNCVLDIDNFSKVENWIKAKEKLGESVYDLQGHSVSEDVSFRTSGSCRIMNGVFTGTLNIANSRNVSIEGCYLSSLTSIVLIEGLDVINSRVYSTSSWSIEDLNLSNSYIEFAGLSVENMTAESSKVNVEVNSSSVPAVKIDASNTTFKEDVHATYVDFKNCKVEKDLHSYASSGVVDFNVNGCTITGTHFLKNSGSSTASYAVNGAWIGNRFNNDSFISNVGCDIVLPTSKYVYRGNYGKAPTNGSIIRPTITLQSVYSSGEFFFKVTYSNEVFALGTKNAIIDCSVVLKLSWNGSFYKRFNFKIPLYASGNGKTTLSGSCYEYQMEKDFYDKIPINEDQGDPYYNQKDLGKVSIKEQSSVLIISENSTL